MSDPREYQAESRGIPAHVVHMSPDHIMATEDHYMVVGQRDTLLAACRLAKALLGGPGITASRQAMNVLAMALESVEKAHD